MDWANSVTAPSGLRYPLWISTLAVRPYEPWRVYAMPLLTSRANSSMVSLGSSSPASYEIRSMLMSFMRPMSCSSRTLWGGRGPTFTRPRPASRGRAGAGGPPLVHLLLQLRGLDVVLVSAP